MIAAFYKQSRWKNHQLLFRAVRKLIDQGTPLQVMLAGSGEKMADMQKLVRKLQLTEYIHFLGQTNLIPELLYHSDITLLTSKEESFGMVLAEGALMKNALIGTRGTGMEAIIKHEHTGLLFESDNLDDLVSQIKRILNDHSFAKKLGENAYEHVLENLSTNASMKKLNTFYDAVKTAS